MKTPQDWSQLTAEMSGLAVPPAQAFRPGNEAVLQYIDDGVEYLAVRSLTPYGTETDHAFDEITPPYLFEGAAKGIDLVTFVVPEDALALQALIRGTGNQNPDLLLPTYRRIGEMIGNLSTRTDVHARAPRVRSRDIAVDRMTGAVLIVPPKSFGRKAHTVEDYVDAFVRSIDTDLPQGSDSWSSKAVQAVKQQVIEGVEDGRQAV